MNRQLLIIVGIVILLLLGGGGYFLMSRSQSTPPTGSSVSDSTSVSELENPVTDRNSLRALMDFAGDQTCTFTDKESGSTGQVYMSSGRIRGDFVTKVNNVSTNSHIFSDGQTMYIWMDGQTAGFKTSLQNTDQSDDSAKSAVDLDREVDYQCGDWQVDSSLFSMPSDVEFRDLSSMLAVPTGSGTMQAPSDKCSVCDSLPADAKPQCLQALGC